MKKSFLLFLILFKVTILSAQDGVFKNISLNGFVELDHITFFEEKQETINSRNQSILQLELKSKLSRNYHLFTSAEFRNDLSDASRNRVYLDEAYIDMYFKKWDLRVGKQIMSWGKADGFNPSNILNAVDYSDVLDTEDENIGVYALNAKWYIGSMELQFVYSPIFTSSVLPSVNSRWQSEMPTSVNIDGNNYPTIYNAIEERPKDRLSNGQFALRLSKSFNNLDFSVSYFIGYNDIPEIIQSNVTVNEDNMATIDIKQKFYRQQVLSGDFSWALGKYILKGEGGLHFPSDIPNDKPYFQYVLGVDRRFSIGDNSLLIILQWMHEIKSKNIEYSSRDFNHLFQKNIMCRLEMEFSGNSKISLQGMYSLKYDDFYIRPEYSYNIADGLNLSVACDILGGNKSKNGLFYGYSDNSRVQVKLKYSF